MQNKITLLFIDDQYAEYLPALSPAAEDSGIEIISCASVQAGLETLEKILPDLVLLDIAFPANEMQGIEGLEVIKKKFPTLPVAMFTDMGTASDIQRVVQCMNLGAFNYFSKRDYDPVILFKVMMAVALQARQTRRVQIKQQTETGINPTWARRETETGGKNIVMSTMGYELITVLKHDNVETTEKLSHQWHYNLLKTLSVYNRDPVQVNLKFISENGRLTCRILFTAFEISGVNLEQLESDLGHDIRPFFQENSTTSPYVFEALHKPEYLNNAGHLAGPGTTYTVMYRAPINVGQNMRSTGFSYSSEPSTGAQEIFPPPYLINYDHELFTALKRRAAWAEIDILLIPSGLSLAEHELLKSASQKAANFNLPELSEEEQKFFSDYLTKFAHDPQQKFAVSVMLKTDTNQGLPHLYTGVENYCFGTNTKVLTREVDVSGQNRFATTDGDTNTLPFCYGLNETLQVFRLPMAGVGEGFPEQASGFHYWPVQLPTEGILLGEKKTVVGQKEVRLAPDAMARHLYIMGQTGTGKSTMLKTIINDCIESNQGFAMIDPHGDLFDDVQRMIPEGMKDKVVVINTAEPQSSAKHNPIAYDLERPQTKSFLINELIRIFGGLYDMKLAGGPMFELYFKNGLLLIMDEGCRGMIATPTFHDFTKVYFDDDFRKELLGRCKDKKVVDFFNNALKTFGEGSFINMVPYITNKLVRFTDDYYLTPIVTAKTGNVNYKQIIDEGKILLVKLDKGTVGTDNVSLLGQMILSSLVMAAMTRTKENRTPYLLVIDEFQNFIRGDMASALAEVRKYGLCLALANQNLAQLDNTTVEALLGNVGSLVFFRPGISDFQKIEHYISPEFKRQDVLKLPNFNCIARLLVNNMPSDPFVFQTKIL